MVAITAQTIADEIRRQQQLSQSIAADQAAVSSGKRLTTPSQDPQAWVQISEIGRNQAQNAAWNTNTSYALSRASKASSNLNEMNTLYSRARELMIAASSASTDANGVNAIVTELGGIRASLASLLNETDYQGVPVFDNGQPTLVPISRGLNLEAVGTRQSVSDGVDIGTGSPSTLDAILQNAITAIQSGTDTDRGTALTSIEKGLDHIILGQAKQGIRGDRLEAAGSALSDATLSLAERRSKLEDTDLTSTIASLQSKLMSLEAAQAAFARINRQNLWDLLR